MDDNAPAPQAVDTQVSSPAVEDNSQQPTPVADNNTSVEVVTDGAVDNAQTIEPTAEAPKTDTEHQPSRLDRRIDQLETKKAGISNVLGNLRQYRDEASVPVPEMPLPRLSELVQGRESLDPNELDQIGQQVAQVSSANADLKYQRLESRLYINEAINEAEKDAAVITNQFEELKPGSPTYNENLDAKIESRFKREAFIPNPLNPKQMLLNPNIKLADIAKDEVEAYRQAVEQGKAQTQAVLATQSDNSAVTPTGDTPKEKSVQDMSIAEIEQKYGIVRN